MSLNVSISASFSLRPEAMSQIFVETVHFLALNQGCHNTKQVCQRTSTFLET
jgi:hypothetical protein